MHLKRKPALPRLLAMLGALAIVAALTACGDAKNGKASASAAGNGTDLAFVEEMVPHHQSAIDMAKIAQQRGQSPFVKQLADDIVRAQRGEIAVMTAAKGDLTDAGVQKTDLGMSADMMGMGMDASMLEKANPFDRAFVDMMISHHQGAIRMARVELAKGKSPALKKLAGDIVDAQAREIGEMNAYRTKAYGAASPAGGVPKGS